MKLLETYYQWIQTNEKEIKRAVRKNITYDETIFDDCFQDTFISVAKSIINKPDKEIKSIRDYFFISMKFNYIHMQNKKREQEQFKEKLIQAFEDFLDDIDTIETSSMTQSYEIR